MNSNAPLAERLRPQSLSDFIGQQHLVGEGAILQQSIQSGNIPSLIFWGPPGVGKTTLASIISKTLDRPFYTLSAISSGVKDVREVIAKAKESEGRSILFIDEIHRFNKSQQDSLLGAVEKGIITLIGATTENPSFEVIAPLLSRCQVYVLKSLSEDELKTLMNHAVKEESLRTGSSIDVRETEALMRLSGGDARKLLNAIELTVNSQKGKEIIIDNEKVLKFVQQNMALYDKLGEQHYDIISAFIKSMRGSDPNASIYWLARMIEAGEDPLFIARRMLILASEDIGNANPNALLLANACFDAVNKTGYPECSIILSHTVVYLATSPKSNATYLALMAAQNAVRNQGDLSVPLHLRNAPTGLMKNLGYSKGYQYAHDFDGNFVDQGFLPKEILNQKFYEPQDNPREQEIRARLKSIWKSRYSY
ncbi:MAG: replication-associated recombination protein A [Bacteroidota bacterium]